MESLDDVDLGLDGPICIIDVETTGLDPNLDRIISVAAFRTNLDDITQNNMPGDMLTAVVDPEYPIHPKASAVNGFKNEDLKGKPVFADEANEIRQFIGTRTVVGHNVSFDKRFLNAEFKRAGVKTLSRNRSACTMYGVSNLMMYVGRHGRKWDRLSLDRAADLFGVGQRKSNRHDAQEDVQLTAKLVAKLHQLSKMPKKQAKAEVRALVESWPEELAQREKYRSVNTQADARTGGQVSGCGTILIIVLLVLLISVAIG